MKKWAIIKNNYVINTILWDGITNYTYPESHDTIIEDKDEIVGIGDWYEAEEETFYRPSKKPKDIPSEIEYIWE